MFVDELGHTERAETGQDTSDSEDYLRSGLLQSASDEGLNIPSTPEFSFDGNLSSSPFPQLGRARSPQSPASESSSYQGSIPGSGRSEQDSYTHTESEQSYNGNKEPRKYFTSGRGAEHKQQGGNSGSEELEDALLRTGYFMPEYKH